MIPKQKKHIRAEIAKKPAKGMGIVSVALICLVGLVAYCNTFSGAFHFDDRHSIVQNLAIRNPSDLRAIWEFWPTRFVTYWTISVNYYLGRTSVTGYHIFNLLTHLATAFFVWWLAFLTFSRRVVEDEGLNRHAGLLALSAGLIFVAHPIQTQAVTYIIQRAASLAACFYVASLCLYVASRVSGGRRGGLYYIGALITAALAMFTKEMTITLPLAIVLYEAVFFRSEDGIAWKRLIPICCTVLIIPVVMFATQSVSFHEMRRMSEHGPSITSYHYLLTQFSVVLTYIRLLFIPIGQCLEYDYRISRTLFEPQAMFGLAFLATLLIGTFIFLRKYKPVFFGVLWFFLALLPESSVIPIRDVIFEHRLYLPMAGFSLFLAGALYYAVGRRSIKAMAALIIIIVILCAAMSYIRNEVWKDEATLWADTIRKAPGKITAYVNRAFSFAIEGRYGEALADYEKALEIDPNDADTYNNRGALYAETGDMAKAIADYSRAIELDPRHADAYNNRAITYTDQGNMDLALTDFDRAITLNPRRPDYYVNRGILWKRRGDREAAQADFNRALALDPGLSEEVKRLSGKE